MFKISKYQLWVTTIWKRQLIKLSYHPSIVFSNHAKIAFFDHSADRQPFLVFGLGEGNTELMDLKVSIQQADLHCSDCCE